MTQMNSTDADRLARLVTMWRGDPQNDSLYRHCIATAQQCVAFEVLVSVAQQRLDAAPEDAAALFDLASGLIGQHEYGAALLQLARLPQAAQGHSAVLQNRGLCHYCLQQYLEAWPLLEACYGNGERQAGLQRLLISTLHHLGKMEAALAIANQAGEVAAADAALAGVLALLYLDGDDVPNARRWARAALELDPQSVDGRVAEATLLTARLQKERARQIFEEVLVDVPHTARAWLGLGTLSLIEQDLVQAKQQLRRSLELLPQHVGSWHVLAWAHLVSGELTEAQQAFEEALSLDRNFAETHGGLAAVAALRGEIARARSLIEIARRLDGGCMSATFAEAMLKSQGGDPAAAQRLVSETVASLATRDGSALSRLLGHVSRGRAQ